MADAMDLDNISAEGSDRAERPVTGLEKDQENVARKACICSGVDTRLDEAFYKSQETGKDLEKQVDESGGLVSQKVAVECSEQSGIDVKGMAVDSSHVQAPKISAGYEKTAKKQLKRKRASVEGNLVAVDVESLARDCRQELEDLFQYYTEFSGFNKLNLEVGASFSRNSVVACLMEESNLPLSKLVDEIYEKLKVKQGATLASVKSDILFLGQRMMYGIANSEADVLEDDSESCLWCWETRDIKFLPMNQRGIIHIRRTARKKISERIAVLSGLSLLSNVKNLDSDKSDALKAYEKLAKTLNGAAIRSMVELLKQKNNADIAAKEVKLMEKEVIKEAERSKRNAEKEKKRMDRELQKEKLRSEKELKRQQEAAEKEERRREKEEADLRKQLQKQQEEAERDQRRREKELAELKKQLAIKKQASIMKQFLKTKKSNNAEDTTEKATPNKTSTPVSSHTDEGVVGTITSSMDYALSQQDMLALVDIRRSHVAAWHRLSCHSNSCHWGVRHNPKIELVKELRIASLEKPTTSNKVIVDNKVECSNEFLDVLVDECEESSASGHNSALSRRSLNKKLLQFDKSHRPAYYGTWSKTSGVIGSRHPFRKDPNLDYDVDSDEEWEEEDPGESLSDCDKDEETPEEGNTMNEEEDESEDSFFVPDGYLSENEGVQVDSSVNSKDNTGGCLPRSEPEVESEEFGALLRQQKYVGGLTELALRKSQPLIISNLMHEKDELLMAEDLQGTSKLEQLCLQALSMRAHPGGATIDTSINDGPQDAVQEISQSQNDKNTTPVATAAVVQEKDLPVIVESIRSHPQGMNKVLESLQGKFPSVSKSQLRNKVREISEFVDNRWQVKQEILDKLGLYVTPDKLKRSKGIQTFFSKRCLPPSGALISIPGSSPQPHEKTEALKPSDAHCTKTPTL